MTEKADYKKQLSQLEATVHYVLPFDFSAKTNSKCGYHMTILFIIAITSLFILVYIYIGYPLLLFIFSFFLPKEKPVREMVHPKVTLIISCYNEESILHNKLKNSLSLYYPKDLLEIFVVSDASTDQTDNIALMYASSGVKLIRQEKRLGKTMGLNFAVSQAHGDVIVFSDANAMYHPDAITHLVEKFTDQRVGYVVGEARYVKNFKSTAAKSENSYWNYEIFLKKIESRLHSVVGGDGAIYAIRRNLYDPLEESDINDFVNPLQIIIKGYRGVFAHQAICEEETSGTFKKEFNRKVRIVNRSFNGLLRTKEVLNPFVSGIFSFEIISHKLLRWFSPFFAIIFISSTWMLALQNIFFGKLISPIFLFFVILAYWGHCKAEEHPSLFLSIPYYFTLVNIASFVGITKRLKGQVQVTWDPPRGPIQKKESSFLDKTFLAIVYFAIFQNIALLFNSSVFSFVYSFAATPMLEVLFWVTTLFSIIFLLGYPLILFGLPPFFNKEVDQGEIYPTVSVVIPVHKAEKDISGKLRNCLSFNYPKGKIKIFVVASKDNYNTTDLLQNFAADGVIFLEIPYRAGRVVAQNYAIEYCNSDIIVFTDVNSHVEPDAIKKIVENFNDPTIGTVSCYDFLYKNIPATSEVPGLPNKNTQNLGQSFRLGCITQVSNGLYATRTEIAKGGWNPAFVPEIYIALRTIKRGMRVIADPRVVVSCQRSSWLENEFTSKVITTTREMKTLLSFSNCQVLNPFRYGLVSLEIIGRKIIFWLLPFFSFLFFLSSLILSGFYPIFQLLILVQILYYIAGFFAMRGHHISKENTIIKMALSFIVCNAGFLKSWYKFIRGVLINVD